MNLSETKTACSRVVLVGAECEESLPLRYLSASLQQAGFDVDMLVFDRMADLEATARALAESGAALAGFSMVFTARAREFVLLARRARELGFRGHLVAGGHFAAFHADALLRDEPDFDSVAMGEGERLMVELARGLDNLGSVRGLVWRRPDNTLAHNAPIEPILDLDTLPRPVRLHPPDQYLGLPIANMLSSRGCTHACNFCSIAAWHKLGGGPRFRQRSADDVGDEMACLYADGYRLFNFHDDNFLLGTTAANLARLDGLANALARRGVGQIGLAIKSRPDSVDAALFRRLKEMGLFRVFLGIEAGTAEALANLGRRQTVAQNERALEILNGLDLHVCFNLLLFNPDSTLEDFRANVAFLQRHPGNPMNFCRTEVYSGTPLEAKLRQEGRLEGSYWGYGYQIRDPRAQLAFALMHQLLYDRHHADENVQHMAMRVDYERQLRGQFDRCPDDLRRRAQAFVRDVNLRSAGLLVRIADLAAAGEQPHSARATELRQDSVADCQALEKQAQRLLAEIRQEAWPESQGGGSSFVRLGVAASLLLAAGGQVALGQHMFEQAAIPMERPVVPPVAPASGTNTPSRAEQPPDGDYNNVRNSRFTVTVSQILARHMDQPKDVEIEFWVDKDGKISFAAVYKAGRAKDALITELSKETRSRFDQLLKNLGADKFAMRESAMKELIKSGAAVLSPVKEFKKGQSDPEVIQRCEQIMSAVDILAVISDYEGAIREIKAADLMIGTEYRDRRYVGSIGADLIQRWKRRRYGSHMSEMIANPQ